VPTLRTALELIAALATVGSLFFYLLSTLGIIAFLRDRSKLSVPADLPPITILKPLKGVDREMFESFRSHCEQDYPDFQIVFGVSDPSDPAIAVVRQLQAKYPNRAIDLVVCKGILGTNVKVSNLVQMLPFARHELLLVNDSDIRVPRDYLRRVVAPFADPASGHTLGLVTCLYRAAPAPTLGSRLEALGISTDFIPGVLSARFLEKGLHFALGSTLAFRRRDLAAIGGFEILLDYLADDYELGRRIAESGGNNAKRIDLSSAAVDTFLPAYTVGQFVRHQLRWARTIRDARRWGYVGLVFTFGLPWSLLMLIAARGAAWALALFGLTILARFGLAILSESVVLKNLGSEKRNSLAHLFYLLPLRDLLAPFFWIAGFFGNRIHWRGAEFTLKNGRLTSIQPHG
jgi:ceramide glucosyltransferase